MGVAKMRTTLDHKILPGMAGIKLIFVVVGIPLGPQTQFSSESFLNIKFSHQLAGNAWFEVVAMTYVYASVC
jgi:hypothetical protein